MRRLIAVVTGGVLCIAGGWWPNLAAAVGIEGGKDPTVPNRLKIAEAEKLVRDYVFKVKPQMNPEATFPLVEITPNEVWQRLGAQVYKVQDGSAGWTCATLLILDGQVASLGVWFGGRGVVSMCVTDFNSDGKPELLFAYSWGSGRHRACLGVLRMDVQPLQWKQLESIFLGPGPDAEWVLGKVDDKSVKVLRGKSNQKRTELLPGALIGTLRLDKATGRIGLELADDLDEDLAGRIKTTSRTPPVFTPEKMSSESAPEDP